MREFGGEGEYGAVRWAAAEPTVGIFWHGPGGEGKRARDEMCGQGPEGAARTAAGRGRVNTSPKGRAIRGATGVGREEEVQAERGRRAATWSTRLSVLKWEFGRAGGYGATR